jgi:hypothetical protein
MLDKKCEYHETVLQLFMDLKKAHDSFSTVLYGILIEIGVPMKAVRLIKCV